jgi:hypothetical protein
VTQLEQAAEQRALAERNRTEMARKSAELELALKELELSARRIEQEVEALRRQAGFDEARLAQERQRTLAALQLDVRFGNPSPVRDFAGSRASIGAS